MDLFKLYLANSLRLSLYQISIEPYIWEEGPRLRIYLKLFPVAGIEHSNTFNTSEVLRIKHIFTSWNFPGDDLFGPYDLLNFSLLGPYSDSKHLNFLGIAYSAFKSSQMCTAQLNKGYIMICKVRFHSTLKKYFEAKKLSVKSMLV